MKRLLSLATLIVAVFTVAHPTQAAEQYGQTITAIFGSGNPDGGWTAASDTSGDIFLGLRGKERTTGATPYVLDEYGSFAPGIVPPGRATWNYEFSIDVDQQGTSGNTLDMFRYELSIDTDASVGTSFITFNPLAGYGDNSLGNFGTANGAGVEPGLGSYGLYSIAQNSQNIIFLGMDPFIDGTYSYELRAYDLQTDSLLAEVSIDVIVGEGGGPAPVPEPATVFGSLALASLAGVRAFLRSKKS